MPASPSFHSDSRKWKRRKRELRKPKHEDDDVDDEDEEQDNNNNNNNNDNETDNHVNNCNGNMDNGDDIQHASTAPDPVGNDNEVLIDGGTRICDFPRVVRLRVNRPHASVMNLVATERANLVGESSGRSSVMVLENISYGQLQALSAVPADCAALDPERGDGGNLASCVITPPQIMEGKGVVKRFGNRVHVVPMHSDWFSPATVNRLERQVVPHFFSGKSPEHTPEKYMECRNYIVAKYMDNPEKRLVVSDCQDLVEGINNEDLNRIFRFLNHWGIINYCAAAPSPEPWNTGSYLREDFSGEVHVPSATLKSIDSLIKFDKPKCRVKAAEVYSSSSCHDDDFLDLDNRIRERLSENNCNYCFQQIPDVYFQSQKEADVLLCSDCFHEGRFVIGHSSLDFIRVDPTKDYGDMDGETWSDQETFLLLEGIEIYNDNWNEIAEHVGTKSKAQCILHFVRLPMEDGVLESIEVPNSSKPSDSSSRDDRGRLHSTLNGDLPGSCLQEADTESQLPFSNSGNPVMALVAFLASAVGPRVAAACAHAALVTMSEQMEGSGHSNRMNAESVRREGGFHGDNANSTQQKEENLTHGSWGQNGAEVSPLAADKVKMGAKAGLSAAATKAKLFADHEEREIQRLSANIINHQLKRLELKLKQFAEVETLLMRECEQVEKTRQRFAADRARVVLARFGTAGVPSQMNMPSVAPSMVNSMGDNRQEVMSASSSQPSILGYGGKPNQPVHPHMQFRPQQSMFPMGQRMPITTLQASSSVPSNVMFSNSGNAQPAMNHPMLRSVSGTSSGLG
ncbi:SWI/SNF complex subunit SWI3C-like isoform X2 [Mangifera indica]|uniref:SWI/SNF complex subunit SWI3C-like isoform X2 n=1 Tax=Mangifera indica TaxID=29780 RepID=UPI001CF94DCB|nr:SWI/SNF complex subunit SWI3C-like isoform X2 [Mangifera indica]